MLDMTAISSAYNFDNAMLKQMITLQRQMDCGVPPGVLSALNAFQRELHPFSQISTPAWLRELNTLNTARNTWQIPELQTIAQNVQRICDVCSPAMQAVSRQQYQSWAVPQIETTMLDLIQSSCANLRQDTVVSALAGSLGAFANLEIPEYDLSADAPELTEEETAQLTIELTEAAEDPQNWQQRIMAVIQCWKERNPIVAGVILLIATAVISQLIGEVTHWATAMLKDSLIREEPTSKAAVVCQVKRGETVTVIGDAPYYYLVEVTDPDTDECLSGYISKKSMRPTQEIDEQKTLKHIQTTCR